jgi:DNA-binding MarR family transcriptional regulator
MEGKLDAIHGHTGEIKGHTALLVDRIPHDLRPMMAEIKKLLIGRLRSTIESTKVDQVASRPEQGFHKALELLTPRERHLISKLVEHGFLTYRELGEQVGLSPTTVKNMINTMSKHPQKVSFIAKSRHPVHGTQVAISEELRDAILQGKQNPKKPR